LVQQRHKSKYGTKWTWFLVTLVVILAWSGHTAASVESVNGLPRTLGDFTSTEFSVFGPQASLRWQPIAFSTDLNNNSLDHNLQSSGSTGRKFKAGLFSLLVPGAGQLYNGEKSKAVIFFGVEAAVWISYFTFDTQGNNRTDTYQEYAGIYAGTAGDHNDSYWQSVGRFMDSDAYNESLLREARALGEEPSGLVTSVEAWQWRNEDHLRAYQDLRASANQAYDRRDFMILFAIVNRAVAVYDAVRNSVDDKLNTELLGFKVHLEVSPSLQRPRAECVVKRSF
jgi:hypothetical protein